MHKLLTTVATAAILSACGGGADTPTATREPAAAVTSAAAAPAPRVKALALATGGTVAPEEAARQLLDFAEQQYRHFFPGPAPTQTLGAFRFRHYPASGTYVGVVVAADPNCVQGGVYVMGGAFGDVPQFVGLVQQIITPLGHGAATR